MQLVAGNLPVVEEGVRTSTTSGGSVKDSNGSTLYFGNMHPCVTVPVLQDICSYFGPVEQVKIIKDKSTGMGASYGFVKFTDRRCATVALQYLNNKVLFGQEMRVNWAFQSHQREDTSNHWHIFIGDLGQDVTDSVLYAAFSQLPGCTDARVMWDHATGRSKGYGFVAMATREEAQGAIERMHGQVIGSRRVRCGWAQHKQDDTAALTEPDEVDQADPAGTNVYVGNIAPDWLEADINAHFASFGPVVEVKLHKKGGYGFVRYRDHRDAVRAIVETNTKVVHGRPVKCSWGKNATGSRQNAAAAAAAAAAGFGPYGPPPGAAAGPLGFALGTATAGGAAGGLLAHHPAVMLPAAMAGVMAGGHGGRGAAVAGPGMMTGLGAGGDGLMGGYLGHAQLLSGAMAAAQQQAMFMGAAAAAAPGARLGGAGGHGGGQAYSPGDAQAGIYYQAAAGGGIYYGGQ